MRAAPGRAGAGLPAGHRLRGRAARRAAERGGDRARRGQGGVHRAAARRRAAGRRGDQLRAPEWVPQLADAERAARRCIDLRATGVRLPVLVPERARPRPRAGRTASRQIAIFGSATETFAQRNLDRDRRRAVRDVRAGRVARPRGRAARCARYVSMCFGDPWEGDVPVDQVVDVGTRGCSTSAASQLSPRRHDRRRPRPVMSRALLDAFAPRGRRSTALAVHFHDTYGQALATRWPRCSTA